jgi:iron complex outermembrane receptor protein
MSDRTLLAGRRHMLRQYCTRAAGVISCLAASHAANSQVLEEVVVSATKRDTNMQRTAIAVSAYTMDDFDAGLVSGISDVSATTPGLFVGGDNSLGSSPVAIRGIGSLNLSVGADEGVGVYMDGVYIGKPFSNQFVFIDVDRIEVLRGPQGTLYGRNATGGALVIHTLTPGPRKVVRADASLTNLNGYGARALLSGPISEGNLYGKIAIGHQQRDGYSYNPLRQEELNDAKDTMLSGALRWTPNDTWEVSLRGYYGEGEASFAYKNALDGLPLDEIPATEPNESRKEFMGATLQVLANLGNTTFTSVTGYTDAETHYLSSSANVGLTQVSMDPIGAQAWYQEFRLASSDSDALTWIVGANFYREKAVGRTNFALLFIDTGLNFHSKLTTESYAAYAELGYRFDNGVGITAGARYTQDEKDWAVCNAAGLYTRLENMPPNVCDGLYGFDDAKWNAFTPRLVLDYQLSPNVFTYASFTKGFRSGGWNFTEPVTGPDSGVDPEEVRSWEAGIKAELMDRRLRTNLAVFSAKYTDLQVRSPDPITTLFELRNAATAKIRGVEAELVAQPVPSLRLSATLGYLDATYDDYSFVLDGVLTDNGGHHLNNAPEWQASLDAEYEFSLGGRGTLTPRLELRYVSDVFFSEANRFPWGTKGHETINARVQYGAPSGQWGIRLFVDNLTDERPYTYAFDGIMPSIVGVMVAPPRIYGAQVFYSFQ